MKKLLLLLLLIPLVSFGQKNTESELIMKINAVQQQVMAQGNITEDEEQAMLSLCSIMSHNDGLANYNPNNRMILKDVEIAPVYNGCEELSEEEIKKCFNNKVSTFIKREFNLSVSKDLNLSEPKRVEAFFLINENGNLTGMKVRNAELTIQAEVLRVLRKIPVMKPAIHNGKSVPVLCSIIVKYGNEIEIDAVYIPEIPND
jgi:RecG-like helicase